MWSKPTPLQPQSYYFVKCCKTNGFGNIFVRRITDNIIKQFKINNFDPKWFPAAPGCSWLVLGAPGVLLGGAPGCSWGAPGCFWLLLVAPGCSWLLLGAPGVLLGVPGVPLDTIFCNKYNEILFFLLLELIFCDKYNGILLYFPLDPSFATSITKYCFFVHLLQQV